MSAWYALLATRCEYTLSIMVVERGRFVFESALAEGEGFEPRRLITSAVFKTGLARWASLADGSELAGRGCVIGALA